MQDDHDPFDPRNLELDSSQQPAQSAAKPRRRADQFVQVPMAWVEKLHEARLPSTFKLALYLLFRHWKSNGKSIRLGNDAAAEMGLSPRQKWRGLQELETLGLIKVARRLRKSPEVTLVRAWV